MHAGVNVAVISEDPQFASALHALFALEQIPCVTFEPMDGLTYVSQQSTGCVIVHAKRFEGLQPPLAAWLDLKTSVIVLSEEQSDRTKHGLLERGVAGVLYVPINSRQLLTVVHSVLDQRRMSSAEV